MVDICLLDMSNMLLQSISRLDVISTLYDWQDLAGSIIGVFGGAVTAIYTIYKTESIKGEKDRNDHLHLLHRNIGAAIANLSNNDKTLHDFIENTLSEKIAKIDNDINKSVPSLGTVFVPLMHVTDISEELLKRFSGSGYVDMKTIQIVNMSKDFRKMIDDIGRQFEAMIHLNNQLALSGLNTTHTPANNVFKTNIEEYRKYVIKYIFEESIPLYVLQLARTQVAVSCLIKWGPKKWGDFFKDKVRQDSILEDIDKYFASEVGSKIESFQNTFKSKLIKESPKA